MPYPKEIASGDSLRWLENSQAFKDFKGKIVSSENMELLPPQLISGIKRRSWIPKRVIALDGSYVTAPLNRHFPVAEAGLVGVTAIFINLNLLRNAPPGEIPRPKIFHDMESAMPFVSSPVPGLYVVEKHKPDDTDVKFFRRTVHEMFTQQIDKKHETLLDTLYAITHPSGKQPFVPRISCPAEECDKPFSMDKDKCPECGEQWYATDVLRLHRYFSDTDSSGGAHGRLCAALEIIVLLNLLRLFEKDCPMHIDDCLFVLDGPLAVFGTPASILRPIKEELLRINAKSQEIKNQDIALVGIEKTGILCKHWEQLDFDAEKGPRARFPKKTVITPDSEYIRKNIKFNAPGKPHGEDTHFGRFVLYKTSKGEHAVINTAMLSERSQKFTNNDLDCFHRLGDILDVMDELATYLYQDGFMPIVRAHANAAIPLKRGTDIIKNMFRD